VIAVTLGVIYTRDDVRYSATLASADAQPALRVQAHEDTCKSNRWHWRRSQPGKAWNCGRYRRRQPVSSG
jgi:hypothetical protein